MPDSVIFCGCSYTKGSGLDQEQVDPNLWVNVLHQSVPALASVPLTNLAVNGATNEDIFLSAIDAITCRRLSYLFVAFTQPKRTWVNPSVETYPTKIYIENGGKVQHDYKIHPNIVFSSRYLQDVGDRFFDLNHHHYDILKVFRYAKLINQAANKFNIKVFFVNSLLKIDKNYFVPVSSNNCLPSDTTALTQKLLSASTRSDQEYFSLYHKIHADYADSGALELPWLNLDQGFRTDFFLDRGNDGVHPGPLSHKTFGNFLKEKVNSYF